MKLTLSLQRSQSEKEEKKIFGLKFSEPYYNGTLGLVGRRNDLEFTTVQNAKDKTIAAQKNTTSVNVAKSFSKEISEVSSTSIAVMNVINGISEFAIY